MAVDSDEPVIGNSDIKKLEDRARELERILGRKTLENEILREALSKAHSKQPIRLCVDSESAVDQSAEEALRITYSALADAMRIATLKAMTALIAHEVSQPLSGIWANADAGARLLASHPPDLSGVAESIERTMRDAERAREMIRRFRGMFAEAAPSSQTVNINDAVKEVITLLAWNLQKGGAIVQTSLSDELPLAVGDRIQLQQVMLNLILNAIDAVASVQNQSKIIGVQTSGDQSNGLVVSITDTGTGLAGNPPDRIFKAFYTTKSNSIGIGLSVCRTIIKNHGGRIWATGNEDGPGACFSFSLPCYRSADR
ncbi:GHKL domain-containing protein (plasmid) [Rhizobium leguminosarum]|uniref:ATP-binding protein n=1 Tax=Rhizobium leguminosarum TaxID=384 RepID=UPI0010300CD5|nr:GHKL domain-containing protein [Rhizobium leguminosarum bv. trifolii]TAU16512.1 GHKL domain-containing protein [Rhizobium leguminosarum]QIO83235.1 GHKL domain-containing protein [Rhizobium leguminosarum bv. trifolii]TAU34794.1 GHKL domain-containing protein [Rhizobium leguminosarum]TAX44028.1 GHKL domain-containing protein [Rhizobium leguminosarum]